MTQVAIQPPSRSPLIDATSTRRLPAWAMYLVTTLYAGVILFTALGSSRVLTRHEVLAAQPAREMLYFHDLRHFILPTLAGVFRTAKPPGNMWLIAASLAIFHTDAAWAARMPSALSGVGMALLMAGFVARHLDNRVGLLAGLTTASSWYILMQARLSEQDMPMAFAIAGAFVAAALALIPAPAGRQTNLWIASTKFYLLMSATFLLKGPIGPAFILPAVILFALLVPSKRALWFLANPLGLAILLVSCLGWGTWARHIDPKIVADWRSETAGTARGDWGDGPWYYYFYAIPVMLLPWLPFTIVGGIHCWTHRPPRAGKWWPWFRSLPPIVLLLICWFVPGFVIISFCIANKHNHYCIPLLPPLAFLTAIGMAAAISDAKPRATASAAWKGALIALAIGLIAIGIITSHVAENLGVAAALLAVIITAGAMLFILATHYMPAAVHRGALFLTVAAVAVGVWILVLPPLDDYRYQAHLAMRVDQMMAGNDATIYLLGQREEEHEAEYAYYLRFPMQRVDDFADFVAHPPPGPVYAILPIGMIGDLAALGSVSTLDTERDIRAGEKPTDKLAFVELRYSSE